MDTQFLSDAPRSSRKKPDGRSHIKYADWYHDSRLTETWNHEARGHMPSDLGRYLYCAAFAQIMEGRSEEHTSELQSLMRISYAVFCLKKKKNDIKEQRSCS